MRLCASERDCMNLSLYIWFICVSGHCEGVQCVYTYTRMYTYARKLAIECTFVCTHVWLGMHASF
jgi:hypothetical protein